MLPRVLMLFASTMVKWKGRWQIVHSLQPGMRPCPDSSLLFLHCALLSLNSSALQDTAFLRHHLPFFFMETDKNDFIFMKVHGRVMSVIITLANDKHKNL